MGIHELSSGRYMISTKYMVVIFIAYYFNFPGFYLVFYLILFCVYILLQIRAVKSLGPCHIVMDSSRARPWPPDLLPTSHPRAGSSIGGS